MTMTQQTHEGASPICVAALYRFAPLSRIGEVRSDLKQVCDDQGIKGTLLLAGEGINGTIAGPRTGIERVLDHIRSWPGFSDLDVKFSSATTMPVIDSIEVAAMALCDRLPALYQSQQALAAAVPEFAPYADMDESDIDDCHVNAN